MSLIDQPSYAKFKMVQDEATDLRHTAGLLHEALTDARDKLAIFRRLPGADEYQGGVEYTELMRRIDAALKDYVRWKNTRDHGALTGLCHAR